MNYVTLLHPVGDKSLSSGRLHPFHQSNHPAREKDQAAARNKVAFHIFEILYQSLNIGNGRPVFLRLLPRKQKMLRKMRTVDIDSQGNKATMASIKIVCTSGN